MRYTIRSCLNQRARRDEFCFRDTVHGFLAWAFASLATAALLTSVIGAIVSVGIQAGASVVGSRMEGGGHG